MKRTTTKKEKMRIKRKIGKMKLTKKLKRIESQRQKRKWRTKKREEINRETKE